MHEMTNGKPKGIVVAGLRGGGGKSVVAVGLVAALTRQGDAVAPFKKGPDYIDAGWLGLAAGRPCRNLDLHLMRPEEARASFVSHARDAVYALVEGNRGLYDGFDAQGSSSTAELARFLRLPVLLVVDCAKVTRTVAAMVLGCRALDPDLVIAGVLLNRVATDRQEGVVRQAVEQYTGVPVIGALPRYRGDFFPQRHLGVTPFQEHGDAAQAVTALGDFVAAHVDMDKVRAAMAPILSSSMNETVSVAASGSARDGQAGRAAGSGGASLALRAKIPIGVIRDAAFQFYYPENLEALEAEGAELITINALTAACLPEVSGLYIGGGFPETSARLLADNVSFRQSLRQAAENGLPIYAECGGLIYLGRSIRVDGESYPLTGVFPVDFTLAKKPQAHGYTEFVADRANPFFPEGFSAKGHEFRYSRVEQWGETPLVLAMKRGVGFAGGRDGLCRNNTLALYTHLHAVGTPEWARFFMDRVRRES